MTKKILSWGIILAIVIIVGIVKIHLLDMPLERDEGEYAYIAQLLMRGEPLYLHAYSAKLPGIYFFYAAVMTLFGTTIYGIHLGLLLVTAASTVLIFLLARRILDQYAGVVAGAVFAMLTLGKHALAFNVEHLVVLLVLSGSLVLLAALDRGGGFFLSGFIFGLAFIAKQHAVFFILFGLFYIIWFYGSVRPAELRACTKRAAAFLSGAALPFVSICLLLYMQGVFGSFWFWVFEYASKYCTLMTFSDGIYSFFYVADILIGSAPLLWVVSAIGLTTVGRSALGRSKVVFIMLFFVCSCLAIMPGLYFRHHYFILLFPAMALFAGSAARSMERYLLEKGIASRRRALLQALLLILLFGVSVFQERQFLFQMDPAAAARDIYIRSPFVESVELAKYIENHSDKDARVIVLGSEPQIYFYLRRAAPVSYIYMYPLLENTPYAVEMQGQFKKQIESAGAEYFIYVNISTSWFNWYVNRELAKPMFDWISAYKKKHYDLVGIVDIISPSETIYKWNGDAGTYKLKSDCNITVFKRKKR